MKNKNNTAVSLQRTTPRLTSNIKLVVDSKNKLFLEMIKSTQYLSMSSFAGYEYNESLQWGSNIRNFTSQMSDIDKAFDVKDELLLGINDNLSTQYQQLYDWGCYSDNSKVIDENMRFFAPIHVQRGQQLPDMFVVLRIKPEQYDNLILDNKLSTWIANGELVETWDMTKINERILSTLEDSYINVQFNDSGELNDSLQSYALSLGTGTYKRTEDSSINDFLTNEISILEFDNWLTNIYKRNESIYSNIVNLEFAFTDKVTDSWHRYVGLYINKNETSLDDAQELVSSGVLSLAMHQNTIEKVSATTEIEEFTEIGISTTANSFGGIKRPIAEFTFNINPTIGTLFQISFNGLVEHTIIFSSDMIGSTASQTKQIIIDSINNAYQGSASTVSAELLDTGWIRLSSNSQLSTFEGLKLWLPQTFTIKQPRWTSDTYTWDNTFVGSSKNTIQLNSFFNPEEWTKMSWYDDDGTRITANILRVYEYAGDYLYELDEQIVNKSNIPGSVWFARDAETSVYTCSLIPHAEISFDTESSLHNDILDFDIIKYKNYLLNRINDVSFVGNAVEYFELNDIEELTEQQLQQYKELLISRVEQFFDQIDINTNFLYRDIDLLTSEATTVDNEYDRLTENENETLTEKNRLFQYIPKWSHSRGTNVYYNPYRANIALPFRNDNFAPSQTLVDRSLSEHTHSWFILADGENPYLPLNESTVRKHLSYTKIPLTTEMLHNTDKDAYEWLTRQTKYNEYAAWSNMWYDEEQGACYVFFRGVLYRFESEDLDGYRFSVMLKGSDQIQDDVYNMSIIRNDTFKTFTLFIKFYIPDPILTSLEEGAHKYYLDRSLLYYSNEIYSTSQSSIDFGIDRISLRLYDTSIQKTYLNQPTGQNWWHQTQNETLLWVGRGDLTIFNVALNDLITVGGDFEISYTSSEDTNSPLFGMTIRFVNIAEVSATHFWCRDIIVTTTHTYDPDGLDDDNINDNIVDEVNVFNVWDEYNANSNVFNEINELYISRAIAWTNCYYTKVVSALANNARYKEISLSNIKTFMINNAIKLDDSTNYIKGVVIPPSEAQCIIRLYAENGQMSLLSTPYMFPIKRYNGTYTVELRLLSQPKGYNAIDRLWASKFAESYQYKLNISKNVAIQSQRVERYATFEPTTDKQNFYSYVAAITGDEIVRRELPWICNPAEFRGISSIVFNSGEEFEMTHTVDNVNQINLISLLRPLCGQMLPNTLIDSLTETQQLNLQKLYHDVVQDTLQNYDYRHRIIDNFITNTFLSIYRVEQIVDSSGNIVQFNYTSNTIEFMESVSGQLTITLKR